MVRLTVLISFLFLVACVYAFPGTKVSLVKNSNFGLGSSAFGGKTDGVVKTKDELGVEFPGNTGNDADISLVDNVDSGAAFAFAGGASTGINNDQYFPFG